MANIKAIKITTGEEILAEILEENESFVSIKNPLAILVQRTQNGPALGFMPWMPYLKGDLRLERSTIVLVEEVDNELTNQYNSIFGTGIMVPPKELIVG